LCHTARSPIEVALPLEAINAASAREKSQPPLPPSTPEPVVGSPALGRLPGGALCFHRRQRKSHFDRHD